MLASFLFAQSVELDSVILRIDVARRYLIGALVYFMTRSRLPYRLSRLALLGSL